MVNDAVAIKDAFIINIGVNFDIIVLPELIVIKYYLIVYQL
jgi:hypothetical protein